jgi:molybdate transport system substrate-binding protein
MNTKILALLLTGAIPAVQAQADEVRLLSNAAFQPVLAEILPAWEARSGNHVTVVLDSPSKQEQRLVNGETYDILLSNADSVGRLEKEGRFGAFRPAARAGVSVAVADDATAPDISTVAAFKKVMLAAKSVATTNPGPFGSSGWVTMQAFEKLGIAEQMKPKLVIVSPPDTAAVPVAAGLAEIGVQQTSELVNRPGVTVVGLLPPEVGYFTTYLVGLSPTAGKAAKELQELMTGAEAGALLEQKGLIAP